MQVYTLENCQIEAKAHDGLCLSDSYENMNKKMMWQCKNGHVFEMRFVRILKKGHWCPQCNRNLAKQQRLEELKQLAQKKGGRCLSYEYASNRQNYQFECAQGHQFLKLPYYLKQGSWCNACANDKNINAINGKTSKKRTRRTIEDCHHIAEQNAGVCLSDTYINAHTPIKWRCKEGHEFDMALSYVLRSNWCVECNKEIKRVASLEDAKSIAAKKGGQCLSEAFITAQVKLEFICNNQHRFALSLNHLKSGSWCKACDSDRKRGAIEDVKQMAIARGGRCLSENYVSARTKLLFECENGHQWYTLPSVIRKGSWCNVCVRKKH